jgi:hypothetical protein
MSEVNLVPITSTNAPRYKYYTVDILSNKIIGEVPFEDVNYELALKQAGIFDGKITVSEQTDNLNLYNATLPGKTALFVLRDDQCVWGGIIWGRTYDMVGRSLSISASEFTSYLSHRLIWKTKSYSYSATLTKNKELSSNTLVLLDRPMDTPLEVATDNKINYVYVEFTTSAQMKYSDYYPLTSNPTEPGSTMFWLNIPSLPNGVYENVSITAKVDTYQYIRNILSDVFNDYIDVGFANEFAEAGVRIPVTASTKNLVVSNKDANNYGTAGVATITTEESHNFAVGQRIELANIDPTLNGTQTISEILNPYTFKFNVSNPQTIDKDGNKVPVYLQDIATTSMSEVKNFIQYREIAPWPPQYITNISRAAGVVTLKFSNPHGFSMGYSIIIDTEDKAPVMFKINSTDTKKTNTVSYKTDDVAPFISAIIDEKTIQITDSNYSNTKYDIKEESSKVGDSTKNYATLSVPIKRLKLYLNGSHGFTNKDEIKVANVDGLNWTAPLYNGYVTLDEVDDGIDVPIYARSKTDNSARLYFSASNFDAFKLKVGDTVEVNFPSTVFDGKYMIENTGTDSAHSSLYYIEYSKPGANVAYAVAGGSPIVTKSGNSWINFYSPYELQQDTDAEPDAVSTILSKDYYTSDKDNTATVTITTKQRHNIGVGDTVTIKLNPTNADKSAQTHYAPNKSYTVTNTNPGANKFSYKITEVKDKKDFSGSPQTGTVTRTKTKIGAIVTRSASIESVKTEGTVATITTGGGNPFIDGDYVVISFNGTYYDAFENGGTPVQVFDCTNYTFSYRTTATLPPQKGATIGSVVSGVDGNSNPILTFTTASVSESVSVARTVSIDSVTSSNPSLPVFRTTTNHNATVGEKVTLSGFTPSSTTTTTAAAVTPNISSITYNDKTGTLVVKLATDHNSPDVGSVVTVAGLVSGTYNGNYQKLTKFNGSGITVKEVPDNRTLHLQYKTGTNTTFWKSITGASGTIACPAKTLTTYNVPNVGVFNIEATVASIVDATRFTISLPAHTGVFGATSVSASAAFKGFITATSKHGLAVGDLVTFKNFINEKVPSYGGNVPFETLNDTAYKVTSVTSDSVFSIVSPFTKKDGSEYSFTSYTLSNSPYISIPNSIPAGQVYMDYKPTTPNIKDVTHITRSVSNSRNITATAIDHGLDVGDYITLWIHSKQGAALNSSNSQVIVNSVPDSNTFTYTIDGSSPVNTGYIEVVSNIATVYFDKTESNPFFIGDTVTLSSFPSPYNSAFTGTKTITGSGPNSVSFSVTYAKGKYTLSNSGTLTLATPVTFDSDVTGVVVPAPMVVRSPTVYARTYGEYSNNSNIGIGFDDNAHSSIKLRTEIIRGSDLVNVADLLERYTNFVDGFDYRIECGLSEIGGVKQFTKTFTIIPITPPTLTDYLESLPAQTDPLTRQVVHKLAPGQVVDPSILGANKVVFEYPGNIQNINLAENAESSATRIFVSGNSEALGGDAKYAAAVSEDLLRAGWPIYDRTEKVDWPITDPTVINVDKWGQFDAEIDFYTSAKKYVAESRPPIGNFIITVNGSLNPVVGSYKPGQWCTINVTDKYIKSRLASSLEPRKDVIVRKIDSIRVSVPNNPAFPEQIELSLVTDWQVDKIGE